MRNIKLYSTSIPIRIASTNSGHSPAWSNLSDTSTSSSYRFVPRADAADICTNWVDIATWRSRTLHTLRVAGVMVEDAVSPRYEEDAMMILEHWLSKGILRKGR